MIKKEETKYENKKKERESGKKVNFIVIYEKNL